MVLRIPCRATPLSTLLALLALGAGLRAQPIPPAAPRLQDPSDGERAVLLVDPTSAESLYVANHYRQARGLAAARTLYVVPAGRPYAQLASAEVPGFEGELANRRLATSADFVVLTSTESFFSSAPGLVSDSCVALTRFAAPTPYTLAAQRGTILAGGLATGSKNHYAASDWAPLAFSARTGWVNGQPSADPNAERYRIGAQLGYTGARGNTLGEILDLIDRSVAADASQPVGTAYYMETTDLARSGPRHDDYPTAVNRMASAGGSGQHLLAVLPTGQLDGMGIMTGWATPDIDGTNLTLLPGAFADHLTSFAATFDNASQTKMSRWIAKGASGTSGAVEEPCNSSGKFPHPRLHVLYRAGQTLGEAWFRSMGSKPFQSLFLGDPLTRPYAQPPLVSVPTPPPNPASGILTLTAAAAATAPGAGLAALELFVDGVRVETVAPGASFALDTSGLADGWHELAVLALDDTPERNGARVRLPLVVDNAGLDVAASAAPLTGDLAQAFDVAYQATGDTVAEVRLLHAGRVVATATTATGSLRVHGQITGAGAAVELIVEALFAGGGRARSAPLTLAIDYDAGAPVGSVPVAYGYRRTAWDDRPFLAELPATFDSDLSGATWSLVQPPAQASVLSTAAGPYVVLEPLPGASGSDTFAFQVTTSAGVSNTASVTIDWIRPELEPQVVQYGCTAPPNSFVLLDGAPAIGTTTTFGVDNPYASQLPGAIPIVALSLAADPAHPCGTPLPGFGMNPSAPGELLIGLGPGERLKPFLIGAPWTGAGNPAPVLLNLPNDPVLIGLTLFAQGLLWDPTNILGRVFGLADGFELTLGQ